MTTETKSATDRQLAAMKQLYGDVREASGEDFEMLSAELRRHADQDPEAVARAIECGELPTG